MTKPRTHRARKARKWWMAGVTAVAAGGLWMAAATANAHPLSGSSHHQQNSSADVANGAGGPQAGTTTMRSHGDVMLAWSSGAGAAGTANGNATPTSTATGAAGTGTVTQATSTNWSGYADTGAKFNSVSASWTQPTVTCNANHTFSSFWVGLDGDGSNTVEQTGTEADCQNGNATNFGWFEMFPAAPVAYNQPVAAGDSMSASVTTDGNGNFTLTLTDNTQGWNQVTHQTSNSAQLASAEVIAEAPSSTTGVLPLSNFGNVNFTNAMANGAAIGTGAANQLTMMSQGGTPKATASALTAAQNFSVTFMNP